jgi:peptide/nickel transport system substrate-binding protein
MGEKKEESKRVSRRSALKYGAAAVVVVGAAAVGGAYYYSTMPRAPTPAPTTATTTLATTQTVTASAPTGPVYGGTLKYYEAADFVALVPAISGEIATLDVGGVIFNRLMMRDWNLNLLPDLAESWTISPDGKTITFNLVKNAQWHDGAPFTADDVVFTFVEAYPKTLPTYSSYYSGVVSVQALDPNTVQFTLKGPSPDIMIYLASTEGGTIIPKHLYEGTDIMNNPNNAKPIGTGPFKFVSHEKGVSVVVTKNENYFKKGKPYLDGVVFTIIGETGAIVPAYAGGEVDYLNFGTPAEALPLTTFADTVVETIAPPIVPLWKVGFNIRNKYLEDTRVRQALYYATDRQAIVNTVWSGVGSVPLGPVASTTYTGKWVNQNVTKYPYDTATAEKLLDEAGFPRASNGTRFTLNLSYPAGVEVHLDQCELIKDQWSKVGVAVNIVAQEVMFWLDSVYKNWDFDTYLPWYAAGPTLEDALGYLQSSMINKAWFTNPMGWSSKRFDDLFVQQAAELDETKRKAEVDEMQALVMNDPPEIYTNAASNVFVYRKKLEGIPAPVGIPIEIWDNVWERPS